VVCLGSTDFVCIIGRIYDTYVLLTVLVELWYCLLCGTVWYCMIYCMMYYCLNVLVFNPFVIVWYDFLI